jgi:hypothetical protein
MPVYGPASAAGVAFEEVSLGAAALSGSKATFTATVPKGLLVILVGASGPISGSRSLTGAKVDGVAGTVVVNQALNSNANSAIASFENTVAGSKTVELTYNDVLDGATARAFVLTGYKSATAYNTQKNSGSSTTRQVAIDVQAGGVAFAVVAKSSTSALTWVGADSLFAGSSPSAYGAVFEAASAEVGHVIQASWSGSTGSTIAAASWR